MELNKDEIVGEYTGHKLECPFCHQALKVQVVSKLKSADVRLGGSTAFRTEAIVDVRAEPTEVLIKHVCVLPKEED